MYMDDVNNEYDEYSKEQLRNKSVELDEQHDNIDESLLDGDEANEKHHNVSMQQLEVLGELLKRKPSGSKQVDENMKVLEETKEMVGGAINDLNVMLYNLSIPDDVVDQVAEKTIEDMHNQFNESVGEIKGMTISDQEIRELEEVFNASGSPSARIESLETNGNHYKWLVLTEADPSKNQFYKSVSKAAYLKADYIRITETGELPEHNEGVRTLDDNIRSNESVGDLLRLERFKEWIKENWLGASALGVTVAAFITTVVIAARSAIFKGSGALSGIGNSAANSADKAGPLLKELLNVVASALKLGAAGVSWLSNNLWVLVLAFLWYVYGSRK